MPRKYRKEDVKFKLFLVLMTILCIAGVIEIIYRVGSFLFFVFMSLYVLIMR
jgi:hypothetical protein